MVEELGSRHMVNMEDHPVVLAKHLLDLLQLQDNRNNLLLVHQHIHNLETKAALAAALLQVAVRAVQVIHQHKPLLILVLMAKVLMRELLEVLD
jgi:hypothetical protein